MENTKPYRHLTLEDRDRIQALITAGQTQKEAAAVLKVNPGTISREIARNRRQRTAQGKPLVSLGKYEAIGAEVKTRNRRRSASYRGKRIVTDHKLRAYIIEKLERHWAPDAIAGRMKKDRESFRVGKDAIYDWLYKTADGSRYCHHLFSHHYYRKRRRGLKPKRTMIPNRIGLNARPLGATNASRYGHREGDTVVSGKNAQGKEALAVSQDRKAKHILVRKMFSMKPAEFNRAMEDMGKKVVIKSLTLDNGIENKNHEKLSFPAFFCDAHSPWQKGMAENEIRLLRRYVKKGSDIGKYSNEYLQWVEDITNGKPRKSLGYQTPDEVMRQSQLFKVEPERNKKFPPEGNCT
jgi:IS30 family transposase